MPWECRTVKEQRELFVKEALYTSNYSALCREYGITRRTGYKWVGRNEKGDSLEDKSRQPHTSPNRTSAAVEAKILEMRADNPGWGAKRIKQVLENKGNTDIPSARTVNTILQRNGCISEEESLKRKAYTRFEKAACNDMWQADFKGEFKTEDGRYCWTSWTTTAGLQSKLLYQTLPQTLSFHAFRLLFRSLVYPKPSFQIMAHSLPDSATDIRSLRSGSCVWMLSQFTAALSTRRRRERLSVSTVP